MNSLNVAWSVIKQQYSPQAHMMQGQAQNPTFFAGTQMEQSASGGAKANRRRFLAGAKANPSAQEMQQKQGAVPDYQQQQPQPQPQGQPPQPPQPETIQRGYAMRQGWGTLLKESMCKGKDCKGCRGCKSCPKCKPKGSTCEKMGC